MPFFKVTQIRSAIGLPKKTQGALFALGLRRRQQTVFHEVNADIAGQIMRVKELVAVSEVENALTKQEMNALRRPDPGYYVEKAAETAGARKIGRVGKTETETGVLERVLQ